MKTARILPLIALATLGLAACSPTAQNEAAEATDAVAADANATGAEAAEDTDAALGAAESRIDNVGDVIGNTTDDVADRTGTALNDVGNEIAD